MIQNAQGIITVIYTYARPLLISLAIGISGSALSNPSHQHHAADAHSDHLPTPEGLSLRIIKPEPRSQWTAGQTHQVQVETLGFDTAGDHWHLYLNGQLKAMVGGGRTAYQLRLPEDLAEGEHEIKVTISNASHKEYDLVDRRLILVVPK